MKALNICDDHLRLPLVKVTGETKEKIEVEIKMLFDI
jgi:hypothetical protein